MASRPRLQKSYEQCVVAQDRLIAWSEDAATMGHHASKVSAWTVGLHVEHLSKTAALILDYLERFIEFGGERGWQGPNFVGWVVLLSRFIPRGSADVPDFLCPSGVDSAALRQELDSTRERLDQLSFHLDTLADMRGTQPHPLLGHFTVMQWFDFRVIHDHHHYKIIRDIERAIGASAP